MHNSLHFNNPSNLRDVLEEYIRVISVVEFNSGRYNMNVIKTYLFRKLNQSKGSELVAYVWLNSENIGVLHNRTMGGLLLKLKCYVI